MEPYSKAWDRHGALSNFSPHSILMPRSWPATSDDDDVGAAAAPATAAPDDDLVEWPTVEHFYQAQKFSAVDDGAAR